MVRLFHIKSSELYCYFSLIQWCSTWWNKTTFLQVLHVLVDCKNIGNKHRDCFRLWSLSYRYISDCYVISLAYANVNSLAYFCKQIWKSRQELFDKKRNVKLMYFPENNVLGTCAHSCTLRMSTCVYQKGLSYDQMRRKRTPCVYIPHTSLYSKCY